MNATIANDRVGSKIPFLRGKQTLPDCIQERTLFANFQYGENVPCVDGPLLSRDLICFALAGRSCHVFGLLMRHSFMAAGHNALRGSGPGQKHALFRRSGTNGLSLSVGPTGLGALSDHCPFQPGCAGSLMPACVWCCLMLVVAAVSGRSRCVPSWPRPCGRSCWQAR